MTRVVKWLFLIVGVQVATALAVSLAEGLSLLEILPLSLILLMSAIPVALPVMFTVSMAVGSVELARRGVLITRLSAAEDAANMDVLCAAVKTPSLFATNAATVIGHIEGVADHFREHALTLADYLRAAVRHPSLFAMTPNTIIEHIESVAGRFGGDGLTLENYLRAAVNQPQLWPIEKQVFFVAPSGRKALTDSLPCYTFSGL